jgi:transcriptional regulator with GAF, ATPase, and Fis domain
MSGSFELPTSVHLRGLGELDAGVEAGLGGAAWVRRTVGPDGRAFGLKIARVAGDEGARRLAHEARVRALAGDDLAAVGGGRVTIGDGWHAVLAFPWIEGNALDRLTLSPDAQEASGQLEAVLDALASDVGATLARLHALGFRHGDVKPANVLVDAGPVGAGALRVSARLIDLGLAAPVGTPLHGGTRGFLPPELAAGADRLGPEVDVYALGATALALVTRLGVALPESHWARRATATRPGDRPRAASLARVSARPAIESAYVRVRLGEIEAAAALGRAAPDGPAGAWVAPLLDTLAGLAGFSPDENRPSNSRMPSLDPAGRARLLALVVAEEAAGWSLPAALEDEAALLAALAAISPIDAPTRADLEAAVASPRARPAAHSMLGLAELVACAARSPADDAVLCAIETSVASGARAAQEIERATVALLRRSGRIEAALALARVRLADAPYDLSRVVETAEVLRVSGRREEAAALLSATLDARTEAASDAPLAAVRARLALDSGALDACAAALDVAAPSGAPEIAEVRALLAAARGVPAEGLATLAGASPGDAEREARLTLVGGMLAHQAGDAAAALRAFERSAEIARAIGAAPLEASARGSAVAAAHDAGRLGQAMEAGARAVALFERLGRRGDAARARLNRGVVALALGAHAEALEDAAAVCAEDDARAAAFARWLEIDVALDRESAAVLGEHAATLLAAAASARDLLAPADGDDDDVLALAYAWLAGEAPAEARRSSVEAELGRRSSLVRWTWARASLRDGRARAALDTVLRASDVEAPPALVGPTLVAAIEAARDAGQSDAARALEERLARLVARLDEDVPAAYRGRFAETAWVRAARGDASTRADGLGLGAAQIDLLARLARALHERASLGDLLRQVVDGLVLWVGAERGLLLLRAPGEATPGVPRLVPRVARGLLREDLRGDQLALSRTLAIRALESREPVVAVDAAGEHDEGDVIGASIHALHLRSVLAVPLIARGEPIGVVYLDDRVRRGAFGPREVAWVRLLATHAAAAIGDARDALRLRRLARRAERARSRLEEHLAQTEGALEVARAELATRGAEVPGADPRGLRHNYEAILGESPALRKMLAIVDRVVDAADARVPVMITGESGTGKELVARAIHSQGARARKAFVAENCGAIPEPLLESTLFGHVRGAFTGADRARVGLFEVAHGGSLFLDEIGELGLSMQTKLLRVLQDGEIRPVGGDRSHRVDVRIIAATHRDLPAMVRAGTFREDLFYRLAVINVAVPPLRERAEDVPLLVESFAQRFSGGRRVRVTRRALVALAAAPWPGNVRQLENEVRRALVLCDDLLDLEHLSPEIAHPGAATKDGDGAPTLRDQLDALEYRLVRDALRRCGGNQTRAAVDLGVSRFGLQKMLKRLGLAAERPS